MDGAVNLKVSWTLSDPQDPGRVLFHGSKDFELCTEGEVETVLQRLTEIQSLPLGKNWSNDNARPGLSAHAPSMSQSQTPRRGSSPAIARIEALRQKLLESNGQSPAPSSSTGYQSPRQRGRSPFMEDLQFIPTNGRPNTIEVLDVLVREIHNIRTLAEQFRALPAGSMTQDEIWQLQTAITARASGADHKAQMAKQLMEDKERDVRDEMEGMQRHSLKLTDELNYCRQHVENLDCALSSSQWEINHLQSELSESAQALRREAGAAQAYRPSHSFDSNSAKTPPEGHAVLGAEAHEAIGHQLQAALQEFQAVVQEGAAAIATGHQAVMSESEKERAEITQLRSALVQQLKEITAMGAKPAGTGSSAPSRGSETFDIQSKSVEQALSMAQELQAAQRRLDEAQHGRQKSRAQAATEADREHKLLAEARKSLLQEVEGLRGMVGQLSDSTTTKVQPEDTTKTPVQGMPPGSFLQGLEFSSDENSDREEALVSMKDRVTSFVNASSFSAGDLHDGEFGVTDRKGVERLYAWRTPRQCRALKLDLPKFRRNKSVRETMCVPLDPPWNTTYLKDILTRHNVNCSHWKDGALQELSEELAERGGKLLSCCNGTRLLRVVDLVCVRLMRYAPGRQKHKKGGSITWSDVQVLVRSRDPNEKNIADKTKDDDLMLPGKRWAGRHDPWELARKVLVEELEFQEWELEKMQFMLPAVAEDIQDHDMGDADWNIKAQISKTYQGLEGLYRRFIVDVLDCDGTILAKCPYYTDTKKKGKINWDLLQAADMDAVLKSQAKNAVSVLKVMESGREITPWNVPALKKTLAEDGVMRALNDEQSKTWEERGLTFLFEELSGNVSEVVCTEYGLARCQELLHVILERPRESKEQPIQYLVELGHWQQGQSAPVIDPRWPQAVLAHHQPGALLINQLLMTEIGVHPKFVRMHDLFVYRQKLQPPLHYFPGLPSVHKNRYVQGELLDDDVLG